MRLASLEFVLGLSSLAACGTTDPRLDSQPTPIMFQSDRSTGPGLNLMSADGRRVVSLTGLGVLTRTGDWSPDGRRIAVTRFALNMKVWLANADGSGLVQLTNSPGLSDNPRWLPDGLSVSYRYSDDPFDVGINAANIDGSNVRRMRNTSDANGPHDWSPDGTRIVFDKDDAVLIPGTSEYHSVANLFIADTAGVALVRLTSNTDCGDSHPAWAPNGTTIAFASCANNHVAINVINADGTSRRALTSGSDIDYDPTWSPDGRQIAFQRERAGNTDVWVMSSDGTNQVNLTGNNPGLDRSPRWNRVPANP